MKQGYKYLVVLVLSTSMLTSKAQEGNPTNDTAVAESLVFPKENNLFNAKLSFTVPNATANKSFSKSVTGIYQVNGGLNLMLKKNFFIGVTFSDALFQISKTIIPNKTYAKQPFINFYNAAVKVGSDFYLGDNNRVIMSTAISVGQSFVKYSAFACKNPAKKIALTDFKSPYAEVEVSTIFLAEPNWGIGPTLSYSLIQRTFDPYELCLEEWSSYSKTNKGPTQYLSFGFICYYTFMKK